MLSFAFFDDFIPCLLLCLLFYCATSSETFGGGFLETQTCDGITYLADLAVL
jgi:hypothetical protein